MPGSAPVVEWLHTNTAGAAHIAMLVAQYVILQHRYAVRRAVTWLTMGCSCAAVIRSLTLSVLPLLRGAGPMALMLWLDG
jgi:hypothetical protein